LLAYKADFPSSNNIFSRSFNLLFLPEVKFPAELELIVLDYVIFNIINNNNNNNKKKTERRIGEAETMKSTSKNPDSN
jgi:hypothetical protein